MRLGVLLRLGAVAGAGDELVADAASAEESGLDLAALGGAGEHADIVAAAAFLAGPTSTLRLLAIVPVGGHPVHLAEQSSVADNALGGRLGLALRHSGAAASLLIDTARAVLAATAPRPFRHRGPHWTIPGAGHGSGAEERLSVTPPPAQLELPIWVAGPHASRAGAELGLSYLSEVADAAQDAAGAWAAIEQAVPGAALRMRRPALRALPCDSRGHFDHEAVIRALAQEASDWGMDIAVMCLPPGLDAAGRRRAIRRLASFVRPALQMDRIPAHVWEYWREELPRRVGLDGELPSS
jgi:luciferase-like monooxygenase